MHTHWRSWTQWSEPIEVVKCSVIFGEVRTVVQERTCKKCARLQVAQVKVVVR